MDDIKIKVSRNLKEARQRAGISQTQIATALNTKQTIYSRYETGKLELDYYKIDKICQLLDTTPNELFGYVD